MCALALPRRPRSPPLPQLVWRAHFARARCWALVGLFYSVRALRASYPGPVLRLVCFLFWGGRPSPVSPLPGLGLCAPRGVGLRIWGVPAPGDGVGGGAACVPFPRSLRPGGQFGWGSPCLGPSLCLPWAGNKTGVLDVAPAMEGVAPIPFRLVLACCLGARSARRPGVLAPICLPVVVPAGVGSWGLGAGPAPASLPRTAVLPGGGGITATASGGVRAGVAAACGSVGGVEGSGGIAPWLPSSLSEGGGLRPSAQPHSRRRRIPSRCTRSAGAVGQPRAPGAACRRRASLAGGGRRGGP